MSAVETQLPGLTAEEFEHLMCQAVWTVEETASFLRVGKALVRRYVKAGLICSYRIGRWIRIPRERLLEDLEAGRLRLVEDDASTVAA